MPSATERVRLLVVAVPWCGGVPRHVRDVVECLDPLAYETEVVCPRGGELWQALEGLPGVRLQVIASDAGIRVADAWAWLRLVRLIRRSDVVHAHSSKAGFLVRSAAYVAGRTGRCVFTPHAWSFLGFSGWRRAVLVLAERLAARWCRVIVAVSPEERQAGLGDGVGRPGQYRLIVNGLDLARFPPNPEPALEADRVLLVSRLSSQKRPALAVEALAALRQSRPSATLVIAGDGPLRPGLEALVAARDLAPAVEFLGHVDDVAGQLGRSSCLLLTSSYEGCPLSVLEAMAAGVPVVATRAPGTVGLIDDGVTGFLVDDDPSAIGATLARVLGDREGARVVAGRALAVVREQFSRERMTAEVRAVYTELKA